MTTLDRLSIESGTSSASLYPRTGTGDAVQGWRGDPASPIDEQNEI